MVVMPLTDGKVSRGLCMDSGCFGCLDMLLAFQFEGGLGVWR